MAEPLLEVSHLAVHYGGIEALCDFSLQLEEGEKVALIGANGAGCGQEQYPEGSGRSGALRTGEPEI
ncbi:hypothetical protein CARN8_5950002 [mine drainage metagenome]|uniref:Uncharacterized protein n=1 Tax=mine drainage metagenome TaxID=410659 RepID=A0A3P3ZQR2_9ZZZZ